MGLLVHDTQLAAVGNDSFCTVNMDPMSGITHTISAHTSYGNVRPLL